MQEQWNAVDQYFHDALLPPDPVLAAALEASRAGGLPEIAVAPNQGRLLGMLACMAGARRILEIGTLGGYSTIWLARALPPGGKLETLEAEPKHAQVAIENIVRAGLVKLVTVHIGAARDSLPSIARQLTEPFDFVFIDADKPSIPEYFAWALRLSRVGGVIVVDNVVRDGKVADAASDDPSVLGVRKLVALIAAEPRVSATVLQTVGTKGYDGFLIARIER